MRQGAASAHSAAALPPPLCCRPAASRCFKAASAALKSTSIQRTTSRQAQHLRWQSVRPAAAGADATAAVASPGDYVELNYSVSLDDGTVVDSSEAAGEQACFVLGG